MKGAAENVFTWALVSEPGFLDFQISRNPTSVLQHIFVNSGGELSRKQNKGVLDRPWTKWMVLRAISNTLKLQFTVNPER